MESLIVLGVFGIGALLFNKALANSENENVTEGEAAFSVLGGFFIDEGEVMPYELSDEGLEKLKQREGFAARKYFDHKGFSIGYGHLIKPGESFAEPMSVEVATDLLLRDVEWANAAVFNLVEVPLNQNQFDALVSFVYNVGESAFKKSTLLRKLNDFDETATAEFARWVNASGKPLPALIARREDELNQFLG